MLRNVTATPFSNIRIDPAVTMSLLQRATREQITLRIGYREAAGVTTQQVILPIAIRGNQLMAFDSEPGRLRDFAIHHITSMMSPDDQ